jgi:hypothetical protein
MNIKSQNQYIYELLRSGRSITNYDAIFNHGIGRLASRICDLTKDYDVPICKQREQNADGKGYHTRYWMSADDIARLRDVQLQQVRYSR